MEVELIQDIVDKIGLFTILVYSIEGIACSLNRQRWYVESLAVGRNCGDARSDTKADVVELTQLLHNFVDLLRIRPLRIEDRLRIIKDYEDFLGG